MIAVEEPVASFVVDGLVVPVAITTDPVLNLCNTRAGWGAPKPKEYLHSFDHLTVWARETGIVTAGMAQELRHQGAAEAERAAAVLARVLALRSAVYEVLVGDGGPDDWATIDTEVRAAAATMSLAPRDGGGDDEAPAHWRLTDDGRSLSTVDIIDVVVRTVAWSAATLLTSPSARHVSACPGAGCGWLFADPRGRRRWCSMAWCGNRNKVRRHAERARSDRPDQSTPQ